MNKCHLPWSKLQKIMAAISVLGLFGLISKVSSTPLTDEGKPGSPPSAVQFSVVDAHGHLNRDMWAGKLIELMNQVYPAWC